MDRQTEIRLIKEVVELHENGDKQFHDSTETHTIDRYVSEDWFKRETQLIFQQMPAAIATANEVPNIGDYVSLDWINGLPLLMVRDKDDQVRVYANVCRHRNARLVATGSSGCKRRFSCPYHAWTYSSEGKLIAAPEFESGFSDLNKDELNLIEFDSRVINGMVFIHPDPEQKLPDDFLHEEMALGFKYLDLENQRVYARRDYVIKANWKILAEGGIEAYHFNVAHKDTLAPFFLGNLSTWESWGPYMRMILPKKPLLEARDLNEDQWDMRQMANVIYNLPPGMLLLAQPDNISLIKMVPLAPGETRIEEVLLVNPPKNGSDDWSEEERKIHEKNHYLVNHILTEDWVLGETIQANMESGIVKEIHFGRFESALTEFHRRYEEDMRL
ncbi:Rieske 2Fe-2S domain-containing protein [Pseudomaricurvus alkylphenolicus]|jgi:nitrite reductase/ring-hydroxylating ferredoxin subunit|uniref:aromatic ring-hydroxylating oxygenase subunit alpha n=1 Tax=Pseudomaricurvus alkylphenolicus TaxID=1306991 RepID=UPI00141F5BB9|nr:SRPBCC family protein [Pseudomaricurvus alkylphenolicus]NIB41054.1 Rieske 2Fe-2S domain-containing protein [Pseudomaricurvus alkylphenolicus]